MAAGNCQERRRHPLFALLAEIGGPVLPFILWPSPPRHTAAGARPVARNCWTISMPRRCMEVLAYKHVFRARTRAR